MKQYIRTITALLPKGVKKYINSKYLVFYVRDFLFLLLLILVWIQLQLLVTLSKRSETAKHQYGAKMKNQHYWISVASQFPNVPDILYNAALSSFEFGKPNEALEYVNKSLQLDPLFKKALVLRNEITGM